MALITDSPYGNLMQASFAANTSFKHYLFASISNNFQFIVASIYVEAKNARDFRKNRLLLNYLVASFRVMKLLTLLVARLIK